MDNKKKIRDKKLKREKDFYEDAEKEGKLDEALAYKPSKGRNPASEGDNEETEIRKRALKRVSEDQANRLNHLEKVGKRQSDEATTNVFAKGLDSDSKDMKKYMKEELLKKRLGKKS